MFAAFAAVNANWMIVFSMVGGVILVSSESD
jgi:hypothetical protein